MSNKNTSATHANQKLGLTGLTATGICSMIGASIYVVPFMIQRNVPGIGANVLPAFLFAAIPALLAALSYAILSSAMPRAGGSYLYASRTLTPYLGFIASFSQWFGLSIAIGVVSYVIVPFLRDIAQALDYSSIANLLSNPSVRVALSLLLLWVFIFVNIRGIKLYERTLIPLMILMFVFGGIVIIIGLSFNQNDFIKAINASSSEYQTNSPFKWTTFFSAAALLFASFIGFDSIAQAGGEAKNPDKNLPKAIMLAILIVTSFYALFTYSVYHTVPWQYVASEAIKNDITAPGLLTPLINPLWGTLILLGASVALINDLPAMILSVSRLMYAWANDGIFPSVVSKIHQRFHTPHYAIIACGVVASIGILGSHFASDFFLGIDIMVTAMLVNFLLMCVSVLLIEQRNVAIAAGISVIKSSVTRKLIAGGGTLFLSFFLIVHLIKDLNANVASWYFHSTYIWIIVMAIASGLFFYQYKKLIRKGIDVKTRFKNLPEQEL